MQATNCFSGFAGAPVTPTNAVGSNFLGRKRHFEGSMDNCRMDLTPLNSDACSPFQTIKRTAVRSDAETGVFSGEAWLSANNFGQMSKQGGSELTQSKSPKRCVEDYYFSIRRHKSHARDPNLFNCVDEMAMESSDQEPAGQPHWVNQTVQGGQAEMCQCCQRRQQPELSKELPRMGTPTSVAAFGQGGSEPIAQTHPSTYLMTSWVKATPRANSFAQQMQHQQQQRQQQHSSSSSTVVIFAQCSFCSKKICRECAICCECCSGVFCKYCSTPDFNTNFVKYMCLDCSNCQSNRS
mgnify:CR=1 FL=1